jgi:hypothetical protein
MSAFGGKADMACRIHVAWSCRERLGKVGHKFGHKLSDTARHSMVRTALGFANKVWKIVQVVTRGYSASRGLPSSGTGSAASVQPDEYNIFGNLDNRRMRTKSVLGPIGAQVIFRGCLLKYCR